MNTLNRFISRMTETEAIREIDPEWWRMRVMPDPTYGRYTRLYTMWYEGDLRHFTIPRANNAIRWLERISRAYPHRELFAVTPSELNTRTIEDPMNIQPGKENQPPV